MIRMDSMIHKHSILSQRAVITHRPEPLRLASQKFAVSGEFVLSRSAHRARPGDIALSRVGRCTLMPTRALTESAELPLESTAPYFELPEPLTGKTVSLDDFRDASALLVIFMCNHCPFVKLLKGGFVKLANDYKNKGVQLVGISSNSVEVKPLDGPAEMATDAKEQGYPFPYLFDEDQAVAQHYQAVCTPEFFLFDKDLKLQYHGQFDSARPSNEQPVTGQDVRKAIDNLLSGKEPEVKVKPSIGCNIKWHPGREPAYA